MPAAARGGTGGDPALGYPGLEWDYSRIGATAAWGQGATGAGVVVGVADTGVDFTHSELASQVIQVIDLAEDNNICRRFFGASDQMLSDQFGGPVNTDWNGHGSWIGGNLAAALDGVGTNGIAYDAQIVAVKISQWCGFTSSSIIIQAIIEAADAGVDILNISFGGYTDRRTQRGEKVWQMYTDAVAYANSVGMTVVASAGNEHSRIGTDGRVLSHGELAIPGDPPADRYGLYEDPGGVPGVVNVSATGNEVIGPSAFCVPGTEGSPTNLNATCKPASDPHQADGIGLENQLAYYSNYGPGIDVGAPGGARKFNVPAQDRGGTPGFPYTSDDLTTAWQTFSTTSNWALEIPCFTFTNGSGFYEAECYSTIQGTSMASPHAVASLALLLSAHPELDENPSGLVALLKSKANKTVPVSMTRLSSTDTSLTDLTQLPCDTGYCHLGGITIVNREAYGDGFVDVSSP
jgi:subtilisin family serine protease